MHHCLPVPTMQTVVSLYVNSVMYIHALESANSMTITATTEITVFPAIVRSYRFTVYDFTIYILLSLGLNRGANRQ